MGFKVTNVGSLLMKFTKGKIKLVHSTRPLVFIQVSTDYVKKILEVIGDKYFRLICAGVVEDMGRSVNPNEVRGVGRLYWKEISHKQLSDVTTGKWMFGCSTNLN